MRTWRREHREHSKLDYAIGRRQHAGRDPTLNAEAWGVVLGCEVSVELASLFGTGGCAPLSSVRPGPARQKHM